MIAFIVIIGAFSLYILHVYSVREWWLVRDRKTGLTQFEKVAGVDKRSLALLRFLLGYVALWDLWDRATDMEAHYTDSGVLPRASVTMHGDFEFSIYLANGSHAFIACVFVVHALVIVMFALGWYTKTANVLLWYFANSLNDRNFMVMHGGDMYLRTLLLWCVFLPMGDVWSVDAATRKWEEALKTEHCRNSGVSGRPKVISAAKPRTSISLLPLVRDNYDDDKNEKARRKWEEPSLFSGDRGFYVTNTATLALVVQLTIVYLWSGVHKYDPIWEVEGTAVFYALHLDFFRTWWGDLILALPWPILKFLNFFVLSFEWYGPLLFWVPVYTDYIRTIGVLGFVCMHLGFGLCMRLGMFSIMGMAATTGLLPTAVWNWYTEYTRTREREQAVLYAPPTEMGGWLAFVFAELFLSRDTRVVLAPVVRRDEAVVVSESLFPVDPVETDEYRWLLKRRASGASTLRGFAAVRGACALSPTLQYITRVLDLKCVEKVLRRAARVVVARSGLPAVPSVTVAAIDGSGQGVNYWREWAVWLRNACVVLLLIGVIAMNFGNIEVVPIPEPVQFVCDVLHLTQQWTMFSPRPPSQTFYHIMRGELYGGGEIELFRERGLFTWEGNPMSLTRPTEDKYWQDYKNHRWFKFFEAIIQNEHVPEVASPFGVFLCNHWNDRHTRGDKLLSVSVVTYWYTVDLNGQHEDVGEELLLFTPCPKFERIFEMRMNARAASPYIDEYESGSNSSYPYSYFSYYSDASDSESESGSESGSVRSGSEREGVQEREKGGVRPAGGAERGGVLGGGGAVVLPWDKERVPVDHFF